MKKFTVEFTEDELLAAWAYLGGMIIDTLGNSKEKDKTIKSAFNAWKKLDRESMKL
jgi:hypothetical protein